MTKDIGFGFDDYTYSEEEIRVESDQGDEEMEVIAGYDSKGESISKLLNKEEHLSLLDRAAISFSNIMDNIFLGRVKKKQKR
jgi:hypothetical protein